MEKSEKCQPKFGEEKDGGGQKNKPKLDLTSRIVGGHPARMPMPWMVLIYSKEYDWRCGGLLGCTPIRPKNFGYNLLRFQLRKLDILPMLPNNSIEFPRNIPFL